MAQRIGDTLDPSLGRIDYSALADIYARSYANTGAALARGIDQIGHAIVQGRKDEAKVKADAKLIEEASKYLPDNNYLSDIHAAITSKDTPLREKLAMGEQIVPLLELGIARYDAQRDYGLRERSVRADERRINLEDRRIGIAEKEYDRDLSSSRAKEAEENAKALSDALSVVQPLDDMLAKAGAKDDTPARKRIDKLISDGRGAEAYTAAKEWADNARAEINKSMGSDGPKLDRIGVTTPEGLPGEMDVLVFPDGMILDLEGNRVGGPPQSNAGRSTPSIAAAYDGASTAPPISGELLEHYSKRNGEQPAARSAPSPPTAAWMQAYERVNGDPPAGVNAGTPPVARPPVDVEVLSRYVQGSPSSVPFGQLPPRDPIANGMVLPDRDDLPGPIPGQRTVQSPRLGVRPLVSPKETPQEALAKSRQAAGDARLSETLKEAQTLSGTLQNLQQTKALLDEVRTGFGAETITKAKRLLGQDVANAEQLQTLLGDQVMARVAQTKGAVSEKEMDLFQQFSANFGKTTDGNRKIVDFAIRAAERAKKIQQTITKGFSEGKSPFAIEAEVESIRQAEPITDVLKPPAPAPGGIPVDEDQENSFFRTKP